MWCCPCPDDEDGAQLLDTVSGRRPASSDSDDDYMTYAERKHRKRRKVEKRITRDRQCKRRKASNPVGTATGYTPSEEEQQPETAKSQTLNTQVVGKRRGKAIVKTELDTTADPPAVAGTGTVQGEPGPSDVPKRRTRPRVKREMSEEIKTEVKDDSDEVGKFETGSAPDEDSCEEYRPECAVKTGVGGGQRRLQARRPNSEERRQLEQQLLDSVVGWLQKNDTLQSWKTRQASAVPAGAPAEPPEKRAVPSQWQTGETADPEAVQTLQLKLREPEPGAADPETTGDGSVPPPNSGVGSESRLDSDTAR